MKILVFGYSGQVATELRALNGSGVEIIALDRAAADLTEPAACAVAIETHAPDAVINAAAYTAVDNAESDEATANLINAQAPAAMARACASREIPFVSVSTDYVFSGEGIELWQPRDPTDSQSVYGRTKRGGEMLIEEIDGPYAILRTSWVVSAHGNNFLKTILRLGAERDAVTIVADQIGGPTGAAEIAQACITIAKTLMSEPQKAGIYHFAGSPDTSWADFARAIFQQAGIACVVTDIPSSDYPTPAKRPLNSRLDCTFTQTVFGIPRPDWRDSLTRILAQLDLSKE
jgi:dTDP-4-dehydrorhamnose reductase